MKASELLRELRQARLAELGGQLPDGHPFIKLWLALPLIADLVEAAQRATEYAETGYSDKAGSVLRREVSPALTALKEALDGS